MRIDNETAYCTDDLRTVILAGLKALGVDEPRLIQIVYNRHKRSSWHGGWAWGRSRIKLSLPRPPGLNVIELARTLEHEVAHLRGVHHREMAYELRYCTQAVPWADGLPAVRVIQEPEPVRVLLPQDVAADRRRAGQARAADRREARVRASLAKGEAILRRLQRHVSRLRIKVRYYDRKAAARAPEPGSR